MSSLHVIFKISQAESTYSSNFRHPTLSAHELQFGCKLGIDSWADTCCAGHHAHVLEVLKGKSVTTSGFSSDLGSLTDLSIANVTYAYDTYMGETLILVIDNTIYLGNNMTDSLANPIQCMDNNVQTDLRPRFYYPSEATAQSIYFSHDNITIPIEYKGPLPFITVRRPSQQELNSCTHVTLTSKYDWDPYSCDRTVASTVTFDTSDSFSYDEDLSPDLMHFADADMISHDRLLFAADDNDDDFQSIYALKTSSRDLITPEELSRMSSIGLHTSTRTLEATTNQCIRTTGTLTRRFRTDKAHLRYPHLSTHMGNFYVDTLKMNVKSIRGYVCGNLYTNKCDFKIFSQCPMKLLLSRLTLSKT